MCYSLIQVGRTEYFILHFYSLRNLHDTYYSECVMNFTIKSFFFFLQVKTFFAKGLLWLMRKTSKAPERNYYNIPGSGGGE